MRRPLFVPPHGSRFSRVSGATMNVPLAITMKTLSSVVWSEGMYLGPHHFQVQSRYFEDSIQFATSALWFYTYGLAGCQLSAEELRNGVVAVSHARGIFPDGLVFEMPGSDTLPE